MTEKVTEVRNSQEGVDRVVSYSTPEHIWSVYNAKEQFQPLAKRQQTSYWRLSNLPKLRRK